MNTNTAQALCIRAISAAVYTAQEGERVKFTRPKDTELQEQAVAILQDMMPNVGEQERRTLTAAIELIKGVSTTRRRNAEKRRAKAEQERADREAVKEAARQVLNDPNATSAEKLKAASLL